MKSACFVVAALCLSGGGAAARTVYRCGSEYTQAPCAGGRPVNISAPVTEQRRAEARDAARREQQLGEAMARERRAEAAAYRPTTAANLGPAPQPVAKAAPPKKQPTTKTKRKRVDTNVDGDFVARVPKAKSAAS